MQLSLFLLLLTDTTEYWMLALSHIFLDVHAYPMLLFLVFLRLLGLLRDLYRISQKIVEHQDNGVVVKVVGLVGIGIR